MLPIQAKLQRQIIIMITEKLSGGIQFLSERCFEYKLAYIKQSKDNCTNKYGRKHNRTVWYRYVRPVGSLL